MWCSRRRMDYLLLKRMGSATFSHPSRVCCNAVQACTTRLCASGFSPFSRHGADLNSVRPVLFILVAKGEPKFSTITPWGLKVCICLVVSHYSIHWITGTVPRPCGRPTKSRRSGHAACGLCATRRRSEGTAALSLLP